MMKLLVENFPKQLAEAINIGQQATLVSPQKPIQNILISGLGGSGIGGTIVAELFEKELTVPVTVTKKYDIPAFVAENTLVIVCSYSGNTEETVASMQEAYKRNAKIVCISSGGFIIDFAKKHNLDHVVVPGGMPPRACLGYSLTQLLFVLKAYKLIESDFIAQLEEAIHIIVSNKESIQVEALAIAQQLLNKIPVIYTLSIEGVAIRFRQQINENSKVLCWHHVIPEMNHNELVGWAEPNENLAVVVFRNNNDFDRNLTRLAICKEVFQKYTPHYIEIYSKGSSDLARALYHIHLTDWVSCYLADLKQVDAMNIDIINHLKGTLAKS